jgi:hypothetical protein
MARPFSFRRNVIGVTNERAMFEKYSPFVVRVEALELDS